MSKKRNYNYSDVDTCMASKIICESFKTNLPDLSIIRTNWTEEYSKDLSGRIDDAIENHLGIDSKKDLREASNNLDNIIGPAKRDLASFKVQIDDDFAQEPKKHKEILKSLGIAKNLRAVQKNDQEALIHLLYSFKKNMNDSLKDTIASKGMNPILIDKIIGYADIVKQANVVQESNKETSKEITSDVIDTINSIYDEIIGICKIASNYFQYEPLKKEQFTFSKVVANMNAAKKVKPQD